MGEILFRAFACAVAGLVAWLLFEPGFAEVIPNMGAGLDPRWAMHERGMIFVLGALIGGTAGFLSGMAKGGKQAMWVRAGMGAVLGVIGAGFGHTVGGQIAELAMRGQFFVGVTEHTAFSRTLGVAPIGLCLGLAVGGVALTKRGVLSGGLGGLIAGVLSGVTFDVVSELVWQLVQPAKLAAIGPIPEGMAVESGEPGRALLTFGLGLLVGLFTAIFDRATRHAWVRLVMGRNEGKEWPIDGAVTSFGRDERATIPLFGDPNVAPHHASIVRQGKEYWLQDAGSPIGVGLNGQRVQGQVRLSPGDTIMLAGLQLQFLMRGYAGARGPEGRVVAYPVQPGPGSPPAPKPTSQPTTVMAPTPSTPTVAMPSGAGSMRWALVATNGPATGMRVPVDTLIEAGREAVGIAMPHDTMASRRHANFAPQSGGVLVTDLGSTNGTFVNGQRVSKALLKPGDTVTLGTSSFRLETETTR